MSRIDCSLSIIFEFPPKLHLPSAIAKSTHPWSLDRVFSAYCLNLCSNLMDPAGCITVVGDSFNSLFIHAGFLSSPHILRRF